MPISYLCECINDLKYLRQWRMYVNLRNEESYSIYLLKENFENYMELLLLGNEDKSQYV